MIADQAKGVHARGGSIGEKKIDIDRIVYNLTTDIDVV